MSKLDTVYILFKRFCKEYPLKADGVHELTFYGDGSGRVSQALFVGTDDNPFRVERTTLFTFPSPSDGVKQLEKIFEQNTVS